MVQLQMFRNFDFKLRNFQILAVPICKGVNLVIVTNGVFQAAKISDINSAILQEGRVADAHESRFQCAKRSNVLSAVLEWVCFTDAQVA